MKITLINNNIEKTVKVGFSWTMFLFGSLPQLFRGQIGDFFLQTALAIPTLGLSHFYFCFKGNKRYVRALMEKGYTVKNESDLDLLRRKGYLQ